MKSRVSVSERKVASYYGLHALRVNGKCIDGQGFACTHNENCMIQWFLISAIPFAAASFFRRGVFGVLSLGILSMQMNNLVTSRVRS